MQYQIDFLPLPFDDEPKSWFDWKNDSLTKSMKIFQSRHPWFDFKKQSIYENLKDECSIPIVHMISKDVDLLDDFLIKNKGPIVIKKTMGHSSKEVLVLFPIGDNLYQCFLTKSKKTIGEIKLWLDGSEWLIEESLSSFEEVIPFDFKCYLINGVVRYVGVINRNGASTMLSYFDAVTRSQIPFSSIFSSPPTSWIEGCSEYSSYFYERMDLAINESQRIARECLKVEGILVSLDMYVTRYSGANKVWLGEITPRPGALHSNWLKKKFIIELFNKNA